MHAGSRRTRSIVTLMIAAMLPSSAFAGQCGFQFAFNRPDENGTQTVKVFRGNPVPDLNNQRPLLFITTQEVDRREDGDLKRETNHEKLLMRGRFESEQSEPRIQAADEIELSIPHEEYVSR